MNYIKKKYSRHLAGIAIACGIGVHHAQAANPHTDPGNTENWILLENMSDEFNSNALDHAKWQVCGKDDVFWANSFDGRTYNTDFTGGVPGGWQYSPDNIRVTNGLLKITTQYEPDYDWHQPGSDVYTHTTAGMWSKETFYTGYMEIRCKLAYEEQTGAFWTTGSGAELDVFEAIGKHPTRQNKMWSSIHDWQYSNQANNNKNWTETSTLPFDFSDGWHTYAAEWDDVGVKIYADGELIHSVTKAWVETNGIDSTEWALRGGQHVWADSEIFEWWGVPDTNNPPSDFEVDYIRVWQKGPPLTTPWAGFVSDYGISGVKTNHSDADQLDDWTEYVFGGNPTNPADIGILPAFNAASGEYLFSLRNDSTLTAYLCLTTNLTDHSWATNQTIPIASNDGLMSNYVSVVGTSQPQQFIKLAVAETNSVVVPTYKFIIGEGWGTNGIASSGNGNFEANAPGSPITFANVSHWFNLEGADASTDFGTDNGMNGSPEAFSKGAFFDNGDMAANDTGYTIVAAGETFDINFSIHKWGGNYTGDEVLDVILFTSADPAGVDAGTSIGDITPLGSTSFNVDATWSPESAASFYTTTVGDIGKTVYLGLEFDKGSGGTPRPRIDAVRLEVNKP